MRQDKSPHSDVDPDFIEQRRRDMAEGLKEAIDCEVARRRRDGLPIHVWRDGRVVDLQQEGDQEELDQKKDDCKRHDPKNHAKTHVE